MCYRINGSNYYSPPTSVLMRSVHLHYAYVIASRFWNANCLANPVYRRRCELRRNLATSFPNTRDRPQYSTLFLSHSLSSSFSCSFVLSPFSQESLNNKSFVVLAASSSYDLRLRPMLRGESIILQLTKIPLVTRSRKATTRPHVHQLSREVA